MNKCWDAVVLETHLFMLIKNSKKTMKMVYKTAIKPVFRAQSTIAIEMFSETVQWSVQHRGEGPEPSGMQGHDDSDVEFLRQ